MNVDYNLVIFLHRNLLLISNTCLHLINKYETTSIFIEDHPVVRHSSTRDIINDVRFVFPSICLIYIICVCLSIVVSNTYCVVFLICFSSSCSCVPYVASFSGLSIFLLPLWYSLTFIYIHLPVYYFSQLEPRLFFY